MGIGEIKSNGKASAIPSSFPSEMGGDSACDARCGSRRVYFRRMVRFETLIVYIPYKLGSKRMIIRACNRMFKV